MNSEAHATLAGSGRAPPSLGTRLPSVLAFIFLLAGGSVRVAQYAHDRSLWLDEAMLAVNIVSRTPAGLLEPLEYDQGAPVLFLLLVKGVTLVLGDGELALRLVPLLASLTALVLFHQLAREMLAGWLFPAAVFAAAFSPPLVYYSQEIKQYSVDAAVVLALAACVRPVLQDATLTGLRSVALGALGCVSVFLSHPAAFALAAVGGALLVQAARRKVHWVNVVAIGALWFGCMLLNHFLFLRDLAANAALRDFWTAGFFDWRPSLGALVHDARIGSEFAHYAGFHGPAKFGFLGLIAVGITFSCTRRSGLGLLMSVIVLVAVGAAAAGVYPLKRRLALYLVPPTVLLAAYGVDRLTARVRLPWRPVCACALALPVAVSARPTVTRLIEHEEVRPLLAILRSDRRPGEHIYFYYQMEPFIRYYWGDASMRDPDIHLGQGEDARIHHEKFLPDLHALRRFRRVWFVFVHDSFGVERYFIEHLDGRIVTERRATGASMFLMEFPSADAAAVTEENPVRNAGPLRL